MLTNISNSFACSNHNNEHNISEKAKTDHCHKKQAENKKQHCSKINCDKCLNCQACNKIIVEPNLFTFNNKPQVKINIAKVFNSITEKTLSPPPKLFIL